MTDTWIATGSIRHGSGEGDKAQLKTFSPGDVVSGLPKADMERLVEVGAVEKKTVLEQRQAPGTPSDTEREYVAELQSKDDEIAELKKRLEEASASRQDESGPSQTGTPNPPRTTVTDKK